MGISVVLTSYNRPRFLEAALESAMSAGWPTEIIAVDDYSNDPAVDKIIKRAAKMDERVCPHFRQYNGGESAALNTGVKFAGQEWIVPLHDDDMVDRQGFGLLVDYAEAHNLDVVWGDALDINTEGAPTGLVKGAPPDRERIWQEDYFYFPAMAWRRSVHNRIGYFNEQIVSNVDWDWKIRCIMERRCGYAPVKVVNYRRHPENKSTVNAGAVMEDCKRRFMDVLKRRYGK